MTESTPPNPPANPAAPPPAPQLSRARPRMQEFGLLIVIVVMGMFLAAGNTNYVLPAKEVTDPQGNSKVLPMRPVEENRFFRAENIVNSVFRDMSLLAIMAIGQTIVIVSGGIDISVGSTMCLSAFVTSLALLKLPYDAPAWQVLPIGIGVPLGMGLLCGLINGLLVVGLRMHPFIVSLATLSIFHWGPLKLGELYGASQPFGDQKLPKAFTDGFIGWDWRREIYGGQSVQSLGVVPIIVMIVCLIAGWIYLRHTVWGRETYAVGGNEEAARYSGIRVPWVKLRVYLICGLTAGIAGMILLSYYRATSTDTGKGYELTVVAAAVVGGASLTGGRGTALGAVLGMLVLQLISDGIFVLEKLNLGFTTIAVKKSDTDLIYGICIIIAVAIDQLSILLQSRRSARLRTAH